MLFCVAKSGLLSLCKLRAKLWAQECITCLVLGPSSLYELVLLNDSHIYAQQDTRLDWTILYRTLARLGHVPSRGLLWLVIISTFVLATLRLVHCTRPKTRCLNHRTLSYAIGKVYNAPSSELKKRKRSINTLLNYLVRKVHNPPNSKLRRQERSKCHAEHVHIPNLRVFSWVLLSF